MADETENQNNEGAPEKADGASTGPNFGEFTNDSPPKINDAVNRVLDGGDAERELEAIYDVPIELSAVLGRAIMPVNQLLRLGRGAVVELDRKVGEAIDIYVNNRLVARGEVVMMQDRLGVTMTEIIKGDKGAHH